jgi:excisionase family DNA binding protein
MEDLLLRIDEASRATRIGRSKLYELVAAGEIPSITIGKSRRIPAAALRQWVEDRIVESQSAAAQDAPATH